MNNCELICVSDVDPVYLHKSEQERPSDQEVLSKVSFEDLGGR